ncbi:MAG TPA: c-type cytochrome [Bryobacteraceae bacterium]
MRNTYRLNRTIVLSAIVLELFGAVLSVHAQTLPEGTGRAAFQRICSVCHSVNVVTSQRMTRAEWSGVVNDMVSRGAQGTSRELDAIVNYLSTNFGKGDVSPTGGGQLSEPAEQPAPLSGLEIAAAKKLIQTNGCLSCHRIGEIGSYIGPDLNDVGSHLSADQIFHALTSPNNMVQPDNRTVQLITHDGQRVTGRILNQDGFSVQLIDSSGGLKSFEKATLHQFATVTTNPMPSYATKLNNEDMRIIVRYLVSLREPGV